MGPPGEKVSGSRAGSLRLQPFRATLGVMGDRSSYLFVRGASRSREELLIAAARVRTKPAALQGPLPLCVLTTLDPVESDRAAAEAREVGLEAWTVTTEQAAAIDRANSFVLTSDGADLHTAQRIRRVTLERLAAFVDLRWKGATDVRLQVLLLDDAAGVLVVATDLVVEGPSKQGAVLRMQNELQRHFASRAPDRVRQLVVSPTQLAVSPDTPPELVGIALAEALRTDARARR